MVEENSLLDIAQDRNGADLQLLAANISCLVKSIFIMTLQRIITLMVITVQQMQEYPHVEIQDRLQMKAHRIRCMVSHTLQTSSKDHQRSFRNHSVHRVTINQKSKILGS